MHNQTKLRAIPIFMALLLMGACARESSQNQPVTTTTNAGTSTAPPAKEAEKHDAALVRFIHAVPGAAGVEVFASDTKVFNNVAYKSVTPYKELPDTRQTFRVRPAGQDSAQPLAENSEGLSGGKHYTVVAMADTNLKPTLYVYNDNLTVPSSGKASVRVINASPDVGEVDVYAKEGNKKLFGGVNALKETSYTDIDPMTATLEVRPAGKNNAVLTMPNAKFEAGKIYTIVVTGRAKGAPRLETVVVQDQLGGSTTAASNANANNTNAGNRNTGMNANSNVNRPR
jgi:hypothetical protein